MDELLHCLKTMEKMFARSYQEIESFQGFLGAKWTLQPSTVGRTDDGQLEIHFPRQPCCPPPAGVLEVQPTRQQVGRAQDSVLLTGGSRSMATGQKPNRTPGEHLNPITKIGSKMGGAPTPNMVSLVLTHSHIELPGPSKLSDKNWLLPNHCGRLTPFL